MSSTDSVFDTLDRSLMNNAIAELGLFYELAVAEAIHSYCKVNKTRPTVELIALVAREMLQDQPHWISEFEARNDHKKALVKRSG